MGIIEVCCLCRRRRCWRSRLGGDSARRTSVVWLRGPVHARSRARSGTFCNVTGCTRRTCINGAVRTAKGCWTRARTFLTDNLFLGTVFPPRCGRRTTHPRLKERLVTSGHPVCCSVLRHLTGHVHGHVLFTNRVSTMQWNARPRWLVYALFCCQPDANDNHHPGSTERLPNT